MTDDTTSITTVSDDQIGSWEDRPPVALSHPPFTTLIMVVLASVRSVAPCPS
jgi:hypothetical protein